MATKLTVYNDAIRELKGYPLSDLTTANTQLQELDGAWDTAVKYVLDLTDWNFARRRATLTGVSNSSYPPYAYSYTLPSDYLRKVWVKINAVDEFQADHAESGATIYGFETSLLVEYMSDHADNLDPTNWPPQFVRVVALYLAILTSEKLASGGDDVQNRLWGLFDRAFSEAEAKEALFVTNEGIPAVRNSVMRRAISYLGQVLSGSVELHTQVDKLRWAMNREWDDAVKYVLEQGAWNFALRRAMLQGGSETMPGSQIADVIEGYSLPPAVETTTTTGLPDMQGFTYGYIMPSDFLHKIWVKTDANDVFETPHRLLGDSIFTNVEPIILEYVASDSFTTDPTNWPATFSEAVSAYLAFVVAPEIRLEQGRNGTRVNATGMKQALEINYERRLSNAKTKDAIQQYPHRFPSGTFVRARAGSRFTMSRTR